jgi:hypothetical protein
MTDQADDVVDVDIVEAMRMYPTDIEKGVVVCAWTSDIDGATVVQIDVPAGVHLRVNVNDGAVFDGDPDDPAALDIQEPT